MEKLKSSVKTVVALKNAFMPYLYKYGDYQ